jgi:hypothetical protein
MVSTITPGTLTVTLTEVVVLDDAASSDHGVNLSNQFTVASVAGVVQRLVSVPTTEVGLLSFAADLLTAPGTPQNTYIAGHFDEDAVRYLRIANKDDTNHVTLVFKSASGAEFALLLEAGQWFTYVCDGAGGTKATMDASSTPLTVSLEDLDDITALADTASVDLEVLVASV